MFAQMVTSPHYQVLPQCWEQVSHKHPERRQLVAQVGGTIILPRLDWMSDCHMVCQAVRLDVRLSDVNQSFLCQ